MAWNDDDDSNDVKVLAARELDLAEAEDLLGTRAVTFLKALMQKNDLTVSSHEVPHPPESPVKSEATSRAAAGQTRGIGIARFIDLAKSLALDRFNEQKENQTWDDTKDSMIQVGDGVLMPQGQLWTSAKSIEETSIDLSKEENPETLRVAIEWQGRYKKFRSPFLEDELNEHFCNLKRSVDELKTFLTERVALPTKLDQNIVQPDLSFVETDPADPSDLFKTAAFMQSDKGYAIVVAGESGSGKSVFSCLQAQQCGYIPLYCCINPKEEYFQRNPKPRASSFVNLNRFLQVVIDTNRNDGATQTRLYALKSKLNRTRNQWAQEMLHGALLDVVTSNNDNNAAVSWLNNEWRKECLPSKVAIIVDEANDIDLAEGLVAKVRDIQMKYSYLAREPVLLVIAGVGLDALKDRANMYSTRRVGTNPAYSKLIIVKSPNLSSVFERRKTSVSVQRALETGLFSRILKTNTRMCFRSVLPILEDDRHYVEPEFEPSVKKLRRDERLEEIASFRPIMDHAPRLYTTMNSVGIVFKDKELRYKLLMQAFAFHLKTSLDKVEHFGHPVTQSNTKKLLDVVRELTVVKELMTEQDNIFVRGLATLQGTSVALKYLSTFGLTCELRATFGEEFEELTALHYMRLMQLQGYATRRLTLLHAWPPKRTKENIAAAIEGLDKKLKQQAETELNDTSACNLFKDIRGENKGKWCIVFSQGTASAQGGDVLALLIDFAEKRAEVETIQCKHYAVPPASKTSCRWWDSLGVEMREGSVANCHPSSSSSAYYSYKGLEAFRKLLQQRLPGGDMGLDVQLGKRTLALSFATPRGEFPIPENEDTRVWFREMFEPTISVLKLGSPADSTANLRHCMPG